MDEGAEQDVSTKQDRVLHISGNLPGMLDPRQTYRLLRIPTATLSFAAFDPRAATTDTGLGFASISFNDELYRPKRVVIESLPDGRSFWRFVPRARREPDVEDEGNWPRVIDICGCVYCVTFFCQIILGNPSYA